MSRSSRTLYVGNLPGDIREREVEDLFYKYGPIAHIELKVPPRPPGYAFVEFEEARDADDAIRGRDGYDFDGHKLRVELAHGGRGSSSYKDRYSSHSSGRGGRGGGVSRRSDYRVLVTGLPSSASWQDLKDHMRRAGDVCFSQVFREGSGKIQYGGLSVDYCDCNPEFTIDEPAAVVTVKPTTKQIVEIIVNEIWDVTRNQVYMELKEHERRVWSVDFSWSNPTLVASGSDDGSVKLWNINQAILFEN